MAKKKCSIQDFKRYKEEGQKWTWTICYDYTFAGIVDESKTEMILVGDSLGNVMTGFGSTIPVTVDMICHHAKAVVKGAPNTFVVGDMPFGTYNASNEQAVMT
ncbi:MAG: 3-methyl-2-oxobutanoate hydroxymethyltransferase, partial [Lachnospiraceae bacterium]|nr:3-methyl-2-oxobutanoate hydroxymethyltransferase [Lachnospiraceae bacterium]